MENVKLYAGYTLIAIVWAGLMYGGWHLSRAVNYNWAYEDQVTATCKALYEDRIRVLEFELAKTRGIRYVTNKNKEIKEQIKRIEGK